MNSRAYFFPPDVCKIGDNLLSWEIAYEASRAHTEVIYFSWPHVADVLARFDVENMRFHRVPNHEHAFRLAHVLRRTRSNVIDLQQLNAWPMWPQYRRLFDEPIHERAERWCADPASVARWGAERFANIFRGMLDLPDQRLPRPRFRAQPSSDARLLLFPHGWADRQLSPTTWQAIAELASARAPTAVVGQWPSREVAAWPSSVELRLDLGTDELIDLIAGARACIGCATGASHLAAELERPVLFLWGWDHKDIFEPVRNATARHVVTVNLTEPEILWAVEQFLSTQFATSPPVPASGAEVPEAL